MRSISRVYGRGYGVTMGNEMYAGPSIDYLFLLLNFQSTCLRTVATCPTPANLWAWF